MDYFPRKLLSKYLTDTIDFNKHVDDIDKWRKYVVVDIGWLLKITRRLEFRFWATGKRKSTFTRQLLHLNRPPTWALALLYIMNILDDQLGYIFLKTAIIEFNVISTCCENVVEVFESLTTSFWSMDTSFV
jgi:hypothetical protein